MSDVIWLTGCPAAGKTTIAKELQSLIRQEHELTGRWDECLVLDSDLLRTMWPDLGFSDEDRHENITRTAMLASIIVRQLVTTLVVVACVSPFDRSREKARGIIHRVGRPGQLLMVHVNAPLEDRIDRDPKGLYERALFGDLQGLTGYDAPYEIPKDALSINTGSMTPLQAATKILQYI